MQRPSAVSDPIHARFQQQPATEAEFHYRVRHVLAAAMTLSSRLLPLACDLSGRRAAIGEKRIAPQSNIARDGGGIGDYGRTLLAAVPRLTAKAGATGNPIAQNNESLV